MADRNLKSITFPGLPNRYVIKGDGEIIAAEYSASSTYAVGEYVMYNNALYRCTTAITTAEAWTAAHWTAAKIGEDLTDCSRQLSDVESALTNIANNEPFSFLNETINGTRSVIKNISIPAGEYTFSCELTSSDTDNTNSLVSFYNGSTKVLDLVVVRDEQFSTKITLSNNVTAIYFYAGRSYNTSEGDTFEYSNTQITQPTNLSKEIAKKLEVVATDDIEDNAVTVDKAGFFVREYSKNLFDPATMATDLAWAYTSTPITGGTVSIISNQYTNAYTALKIPLRESANSISIINYAGSSGTIYSYYFTDTNSACISYEYNVAYSVATGKTLTVPSGAVYLYITLKNGHNYETAKLMISATAEPIAYEDYETFLTIPSLKVEGGGSVEWEHNATLSLPDKYELVVGDTFELFYQGIVKATHWDVFDVEVTCQKGSAFERKYVYTPVPADIGNVPCIVTLYDPYHKKMDEKTVTLSVKAKASSPASQKVVLYVGDSLTNGGYAPGEFKRRLVGSGGTPAGDGLSNITFIGTVHNNDCDYEGYGGWTWTSYNTDNSSNAYMWITVASHDKTETEDQHSIYRASNSTEWKLETIESGRIKIIRTTGTAALPSSGTLTWVSGGTNHSDIVYSASAQAAGNPFWNESSNKVDFASYATAQGVSRIDYVYVLLGWNGSGTSESDTKANVKTFIDNVLTSFPNCKIVLLGIQCPARDGLATNYGASGILAHFYSALSHMCNLNKWYADVAADYANVSFVNIAGQFDTKYNMPTTSMQVNARNTATVSIQSNGVHPLPSGYYQIADACWRDFHHKLQE